MQCAVCQQPVTLSQAIKSHEVVVKDLGSERCRGDLQPPDLTGGLQKASLAAVVTASHYLMGELELT